MALKETLLRCYGDLTAPGVLCDPTVFTGDATALLWRFHGVQVGVI